MGGRIGCFQQCNGTCEGGCRCLLYFVLYINLIATRVISAVLEMRVCIANNTSPLTGELSPGPVIKICPTGISTILLSTNDAGYLTTGQAKRKNQSKKHIPRCGTQISLALIAVIFFENKNKAAITLKNTLRDPGI